METGSCSSDYKDIEESQKFNSFIDSDSDDEEYDEDDFTFACATENDTSSSTEHMLNNGKTRTVFPLFDQSLVFTGVLPHMPPVKNIFVETCDAPPLLLATEHTDGAVGPHCTLYRKAVEVNPAASPDSCKKSNSTGFSKIWRFKEMSNRSHSDGKDAFVFLNKPVREKKSKDSTVAASGKPAVSDGRDTMNFLNKLALQKRPKDSVAAARGKSSGSDGREIVASGGERDRVVTAMVAKKKGGGKEKTVVSAHEVYMKSIAATREEDRRRSYLPYKPELVGFFTNVHGGMSKNVHPF